ncbi:hypothetical protein [Variovorax sp. JS1663]|uniref:hypothetical protein n=1 Tax=Variovorax sp. JS1663 TaxID=1851577 RepID=UPI000B6BC341|nr:hypothetical protein [Variovorax sp. JS1663]OUM01564.1 hypothetical protein A8M77_14905 [Variovorax sp. JS1663]
MNKKPDTRGPWDAAFASMLPGKLLLVGLTYLEADGTLIDKQQIFGRVLSATPQGGIQLRLEGRRGGERYVLPPDLQALQKAKPGEYQLPATGETVPDPDYTIVFSIRKRPDRPPPTRH